ncbi:hypothetical protein H1C71_013804 [Ictidomys tridecemlineatus]|uniref:uncharacterized protein LOC120888646 n=1 Tax=Ictidomys tridecemlineatus TaxID=43179 RepID=UPI001A9D0FA2|nr:uncharacterized protein LOC120888646 [Ictidomys tridecemlineatus]XP_040137891.1 uncharacterized protein LOC120888646 [Ictidomys tridecemlineatus]KAG3292458.1 hypothetical protein H1C71_013804 [Ictidomys tridecemlineatus]
MADKTKLWGVVPTILEMSKDPTNFYIGRTLWFSVTFIYVSVVHIVKMSWIYVETDFQCHGNISDACLAECYEDHFTKPILGVWYMVGFVFTSFFFVMEFAILRGIYKENMMFKKQSLEKENLEDNNADEAKKEEEIFDLSKRKPILAMYLVYFMLQMSVQVIFLAILMHYQEPLIRKKSWCSTDFCQGPYLCVLMGTEEKRMSIIILASLSVVIMTFCIIFFIYSINEYRVKSIALFERYKSSIRS